MAACGGNCTRRRGRSFTDVLRRSKPYNDSLRWPVIQHFIRFSMWQDVLEKIQRLKSLDKNLVVFGADIHKYQLRPTISIAELEIEESRLGTTLPEELRNFYLEVGNGGVGPDYGLYAVEQLESVRAEEPWPGIDAIDAEDCSTDSLSGVIALMDRYYDYRSYVVCNGADTGRIIAFEEAQFSYEEAGSLHEVYCAWLTKELSMLDACVAALRATTDIAEIAQAQRAAREIHPENTLQICASLLGMAGFTLGDAQGALRWSGTLETPVFAISPDMRDRFATQIARWQS